MTINQIWHECKQTTNMDSSIILKWGLYGWQIYGLDNVTTLEANEGNHFDVGYIN